jgi:hypothetical protein
MCVHLGFTFCYKSSPILHTIYTFVTILCYNMQLASPGGQCQGMQSQAAGSLDEQDIKSSSSNGNTEKQLVVLSPCSRFRYILVTGFINPNFLKAV